MTHPTAEQRMTGLRAASPHSQGRGQGGGSKASVWQGLLSGAAHRSDRKDDEDRASPSAFHASWGTQRPLEAQSEGEGGPCPWG